MALQINFTSTKFGVTSTVAYAKIDSFSGSLAYGVNFYVNIYASAQARLDGLQPIGDTMFNVPYSDNMTFTGVYTYAKTLPEFTGAIDV
jgi:hypothetical protein